MRIKTTLIPILAIACLSSAPTRATTVAGVEFDERVDWNGTTLRLNGAGLLRYRVVFKGYAAALYLGEGVSPSRALEDVPRRLEIEYFWPIPADAFARITIERIERDASPEARARFGDALARFAALYEDVRPGDRYSLTYVPGIGTELALNGEPCGVIEGASLSTALFSLWLGPQPVDEPLRAKLLARS